jgi:hypothetical protein
MSSSLDSIRGFRAVRPRRWNAMQCNDWHRLNRKKDRKLLLAEREDKTQRRKLARFLGSGFDGLS